MKLSIRDGALYAENVFLCYAGAGNGLSGFSELHINWFGDGFGFVPPAKDSTLNKGFPSAKPFAPLSVRERFSVMRDEFIFSRVVVLLLVTCPSAIFRAVRSVAVNPVYRHSVWAATHVGKKVLEGSYPAIAHGYSATAVYVKERCFWIRTTLFHAEPNFVLSGFCFPMSPTAGAGFFNNKAPAGLCGTAHKMPSGNRLCRSAFARANPNLAGESAFFAQGDYGQSSKFLTRDVFYLSAHFVTSKLLTVKSAWQSAVRQIFGSYPSQARMILS